MYICRQDDPIFALCHSSCNREIFTSGNTCCCIFFASELISLSNVQFFICFLLSNSVLFINCSLYLLIFFNYQKISSLAENTSSKIVFNEVLAAAGRDIVSKDISRLRGGWPMQDAFYVSPSRCWDILNHCFMCFKTVFIFSFVMFLCEAVFWLLWQCCWGPLVVHFSIL